MSDNRMILGGLRNSCAMKLSRINRGGVDGPVPRLVVVKPDEGRVVDLVSAEKLRLMRKGATSAGALFRASGLFPGSMAQAISTGSAFLESAAETVAATGDDASIEFSNVEWIAAVDP